MDFGSLPVVSHVHRLLASNGLELSPTIVFVTLVFAVLIPVLLIFFRSGGNRRKGGDAILLLGLSGAGKTAIFGRLKNGTLPKTLVSMETNNEKFPFADDKNSPRAYHVIDFPGHHRLREGLSKVIPQAKAIIFMIDSNADVASVRQSAEYLYTLLTNPNINKHSTPFLIVCNKTDLVTANSVDKITKELEAELNELRKSKTATPGHADKEDEVFLGIEGEKISLKHLPLSITCTACSVKSNQLQNVVDFIKHS